MTPEEFAEIARKHRTHVMPEPVPLAEWEVKLFRDKHAHTVMRILVAELRAHTGHFGGTLQEALGDSIHDNRLRDGCLTCRLLELAEGCLTHE